MIKLSQAQSPDTTLAFDVSDRGLLLGDGVFDTAMVLNGKMVFRDAHIKRLLDGLGVLGIPADYERIFAAAEDVLAGAGDGVLRLTVTRGRGVRGLQSDGGDPTILAHLHPEEGPMDVFSGLKVATSTIRRNDLSPSSRIKSLAYTDNILAAREAQEIGAGDALMLNTANRAACFTTGNLFATFGDKWVTPPLEEGALPGVIRGWILKNGGDFGLDVQEGALVLGELEKADALYATNSVRLIRCVTYLDGVKLGYHPHTALSQGLLDAISQEVGPHHLRPPRAPA